MSKANSVSSTKRRSKFAKKASVAKPVPSKGPSRRPTSQSTLASSGSMLSPGTKGARIIDMLRSPAGTTISAMTSATGWQSHSIRGFLAGMVRKRLSLNLISEPGDKGRIYRVKDRKAQPAKGERISAA